MHKKPWEPLYGIFVPCERLKPLFSHIYTVLLFPTLFAHTLGYSVTV
jgi:hypothetical protein